MTADDSRDHPLSCNWRPVRPDAYDDLGLPPARSKAAALARAQILTEAFVIGRSDPRAWVSYSRRREFYTARRGRYWPSTYTFNMVVPAVGQLADLGALDHEKVPQGNIGWQSRFKASAEFMKLLNTAPPEVVHDPRERIILRTNDGYLIDYKETERTLHLRRNVDEINEALQSTEIGLRGHVVREGDPLQVGVTSAGAASNLLHRVFSRCSFGLDGRFYGGWWQNIPSAARARISISGIGTVELDFPYLHPSLLYLEAGVQMQGDPYDLIGWPRKTVKIAFNTLVNADSPLSALRSIAKVVGGEGAFAKARALVQELEARHQSIAPKFGTAAGLRLMRCDSDLTEFIALRLARKGVVSLPIHDSYIVRDHRSDKGNLLEAMAEALWRLAPNSNGHSIGYRKNIPQYGGRRGGRRGGGRGRGRGRGRGDEGIGLSGSGTSGVADLIVDRGGKQRPSARAPSADGNKNTGPAGPIVVFFNEQRQRDLFGADALNVPYKEIFGWRGGTAPLGARKALRHEMRRLGLRHIDVAHRVGISRSHLGGLVRWLHRGSEISWSTGRRPSAWLPEMGQRRWKKRVDRSQCDCSEEWSPRPGEPHDRLQG
jgi:hypothetical protein